MNGFPNLSTLRSLVLALLGLAAATPALAGDTHYLGQVDVEPLSNKGYSGYIGVSPEGHPATEFSLGGWSYDESSGFIKFLNSKNQGFDVRQTAEVISVRHYHGTLLGNGEARGFFTGCMLGRVTYDYTRPDSPGEKASDLHFLGMPGLGYKLFPLEDTVYLSGSVGAMINPRLSGSTDVGGHSYDESRVMPFFSIMIGAEL